jgi:ABC-2 type transport system permease protein
MFAPSLLERATRKVQDVRDRRFAVIDRTPGRAVLAKLNDSVEKRNARVASPAGARQSEPRFVLEPITPAGANSTDAAALQQRFELAQRVRTGELFGIVDIGADVLTGEVSPAATQPEAASADDVSRVPPAQLVRYYTNTPTYLDFRNVLQNTLNKAAQTNRLRALGVTTVDPDTLLAPVVLQDHGLPRKAADGQVTEGEATDRITSIMVPLGLAFLMLIVVLIGAIPMMQGIMEEKQQRIAEVLLGSVSPFRLMAGKVLGLVATSLTLIAFYLGAAYFGARQKGLTDFLPTSLILWFVVFQILAVLMYGSLYIAIGAACTDAKEMQSLILPVNMLLIIPLAVIGNVVQNPNGPLARIATLFPPATPMITVLRLAVPPGIPGWEVAVAITIVLVTTVVFIWASGRIFRVGILMQGKGANVRDLLRWVVAG